MQWEADFLTAQRHNTSSNCSYYHYFQQMHASAGHIVQRSCICYAALRCRLRGDAVTDAAKDTFQGESMGQDIFDLIVVLTLAFFAGRGYINGFVGEVAGIVSLLGGFWVAHNYHDMLSPHLAFITDPGWRTIAAYVLVFLGVLIAVALLARLLQKILSFSFVSWADRMAGAALGLAKGALLWSLGMIVLQKFFSHAAFMQHSRVLPYFTALTAQVRGWLPPDLVSRLGL